MINETQKNGYEQQVKDQQKIPITLYLDSKEIEQARKIGDGDFNRGITTALAVCRVIKQKSE
jgi:hypothetical protein